MDNADFFYNQKNIMNNGNFFNSNYRANEANVIIDENSPEVLTNNIYTPAFLRENIGKLMRVEFLIGTNMLEDRTGILVDVGASYILLRSIQGGNLLFCDIYSIKFVTISEEPFIYNPSFQLNMR